MLLVVAVGYYVVRREEGMGHGDIILMGMAGAVLGWGRILLTVFLGSFLGALVGLVLIQRAGGDRKYEIPFGTFLCIAAIGALFFGDVLLEWYWGLL
jgi:leader peptidase (prepilin peptidase)/N-methyltransferase